MSQSIGKSSKFLFINISISIEIKFLKAFLNFIFFLQFVEMFHSSYSAKKLLYVFIVIHWKESWQLINKFFIELSLHICNSFKSILNIILFDSFDRHRDKKIDDRNQCIKFEIVRHILKIQLFKAFHEKHSYCIVFVFSLVLDKIIISSALHFQSAFLLFFNNFRMLKDSIEKSFIFFVWHHSQHFKAIYWVIHFLVLSSSIFTFL